jgi:ABC-type antimicrobial peptide transport system permease subunit
MAVVVKFFLRAIGVVAFGLFALACITMGLVSILIGVPISVFAGVISVMIGVWFIGLAVCCFDAVD